MTVDFELLAADDLGPGTTNVADLAGEVARAAGWPDGVPVLLFPVRIETRFVQRERPITAVPATGAITDALGVIGARLERVATLRLASTVEPAGEPGRPARRDLRKLDEKANHEAVLAAIGEAGEAAAQLAELARVRTSISAAEAEAMAAALAVIDGAMPKTRAAIAAMRSAYQRGEAIADLDELAGKLAEVRATLGRRRVPSGAARPATVLTDELLVRIYPDDIAVDTHEDALTASEQASGLTFWTETRRAGGDETLERGAWRALCQRHGVRRAAWIARTTEPAAPAPPTPAARVIRSLEVLERRIEEVAGASEPARLRAFDRAVSDLTAAIPATRTVEPALLARTAPMVAAIRRRVMAIGVDATMRGMRRAELAPPRARVLSALREVQTWTTEAARPAPSRMGAARRPPKPPQGAGGGMVRALATFAGRLDEIAAWDQRRAPSWVKSLGRAIDEVRAALAVEGGAGPAARQRAERQMATVVAKLRALATPARQREVLPELVREVRRQAARMGADWNRWRDRVAATPLDDTPALRPVATKPAPWTRAASSTILPARFVVVAVAGDRVAHAVVGRAVPPDLKLGIDPDPTAGPAEAFRLEDGNLVVGASIRWMVDYGEAEAKGMAITVPITPAEAVKGFDRVYVLGLCDGDPADGRRRVEALVENHHYGQTGLGLLPIGTATNNADGASAGYRSIDDPDAAFDVERRAPLFTPGAPPREAKDGQRLASALGIAPEHLAHVEHAGGRDAADAIVVNTALWPATLGHYFEEFFGALFPVPVLDEIKAHALEHVAGRGLIPSFRVGVQPYGVLPTTAYSKLRWPGPARGVLPIMTSVLRTMHADWSAIREVRVKHAHTDVVADAQQHFLEMLGLEATSVAADYRFALNCARQHPAAVEDGLLDFGLPGSDTFGPAALIVKFADELRTALNLPPGPPLDGDMVGSAFDKAHRRLKKTRAYEVRYLSEPRPLTGAVVGDHVAYIAQLVQHDLRSLAAQTRSDPGPRALLYLLLRQALLLETREAALRILAREGMLTAEARRRSGESDVFQVHTLSADWSVTRWSYLFAPLSQLDHRFGVDFPTTPGSLYTYLTSGGERPMDAYVSPRQNNPVTLGFAGRAAHQPFFAARDAHVAAVEELATIPRERLEPLVLEHLDTCGHRLDAWMTGLAHRRLTAMRAAAPDGVLVGAYGWVERLVPDRTAAGRALATGLPPELAGNADAPVHLDPQSQGFIHAPSLNHAVTASILRSGYLSEVAIPDVENRMAVNLSSRRVRLAAELIEGVRMGNDLGSLLGYMFERHLHESHASGTGTLDDLIEPFRVAYPSQLAVDPALATEATARRRVVDGLSLVQAALAWVAAHPRSTDKDRTLFEILHDRGSYAGHPFGVTGLPPITAPVRLDAVLRGLDGMADALDAVGDLVVSEGVYQIVQGNHARAAAAVGALTRGKAPPPPEVIQTPRSGITISHRVVLALPRPAAAPAGPAAAWSALPTTPRAAAEPSVNRWLAERLGAPAELRARVRDAATGQVVRTVSAADLDLQPIDLLALLGPGYEAGLGELDARILDVARPADVVDTAPPPRLIVDHEADPAWPAGARSFAEASALLECLGDVLRHGRAATGHDFALAEGAAVADGVDVAELTARALAARDHLRAAAAELLAILTAGTVTDWPAAAAGDLGALVAEHEPRFLTAPGADGRRTFVDLAAFWAQRVRIRSALIAAADLGVTRAMPPTAFASAPPIREPAARMLLEKMQAALLELGTRWRTVAAADLARAGAADPAAPLVAMVKGVFGEAFAVIPRFTLAAGPAATALAAPQSPADDPALTGWLHGVAAVREHTAELANLLAIADAFGATSTARPIQLPFVANEPWLGGRLPAAFTPSGGRLSIVVFDAAQLVVGATACAIAIDHWDEQLPNRDETTAVAFHYDQPDAMPPQSLLLVVPPVVTGHWQWPHLVQALHETLELAKNRAVELEHLHDDIYGQILPGVVGELVPEAVTATTGEVAGSRVILDFGTNNPPPTP